MKFISGAPWRRLFRLPNRTETKTRVSKAYEWIDRQEELDTLVDIIANFDEVPLDTEADNMYHYRNRICLFQIKAGDRIFLVDVLEDLDMRGLMEVFRTRLLIMHGSDFDLRLMADHYSFRPERLFDTMLGAQLLGLPKTGLGGLVEHYVGIEMPKGHQKSDWSKRPLPKKMLDYAAEDVLYLEEIRKKMLAELKRKKRVDWLQQRCEFQIEAAVDGFGEKDENAWRLAGSTRLPPRSQAVLYELWHWRERSAEKADLPPFKILNNNFLVDVAAAAGRSSGTEWHKALPARLFARHRKALEKAIQRGRERDPDSLPSRPNEGRRRQPFSAEELERQEALRELRDRKATKLGIDPSLIANRTQLAVLSRNQTKMDELLLPWQAELLREGLDLK
jgi:ribonuclease D